MDTDTHISSAGRISNPYVTKVIDIDNSEAFKGATVGAYSRALPAVTIFGGPDCTEESVRFYYNPDPSENGAEYLSIDLDKSFSLTWTI